MISLTGEKAGIADYEGVSPQLNYSMKLSYRGSIYELPPDIAEVSETEVIGKYRGNPITFRQPSSATQPQVVALLTYRGNTYLRVR